MSGSCGQWLHGARQNAGQGVGSVLEGGFLHGPFSRLRLWTYAGGTWVALARVGRWVWSGGDANDFKPTDCVKCRGGSQANEHERLELPTIRGHSTSSRTRFFLPRFSPPASDLSRYGPAEGR